MGLPWIPPTCTTPRTSRSTTERTCGLGCGRLGGAVGHPEGGRDGPVATAPQDPHACGVAAVRSPVAHAEPSGSPVLHRRGLHEAGCAGCGQLPCADSQHRGTQQGPLGPGAPVGARPVRIFLTATVLLFQNIRTKFCPHMAGPAHCATLPHGVLVGAATEARGFRVCCGAMYIASSCIGMWVLRRGRPGPTASLTGRGTGPGTPLSAGAVKCAPLGQLHLWRSLNYSTPVMMNAKKACKLLKHMFSNF